MNWTLDKSFQSSSAVDEDSQEQVREAHAAAARFRHGSVHNGVITGDPDGHVSGTRESVWKLRNNSISCALSRLAPHWLTP